LASDARAAGIFGRVAIIEALPVSESLRRLIIKRALFRSPMKNQAMAEGDENSAMVGLDKALEGVTTLEEIWRVTGRGPLMTNDNPIPEIFSRRSRTRP